MEKSFEMFVYNFPYMQKTISNFFINFSTSCEIFASCLNKLSFCLFYYCMNFWYSLRWMRQQFSFSFVFLMEKLSDYTAGIYLLKVNNRNTKKRREICSKLTIKTPERRQRRRSGHFIVNFESILYFVLVFLLLTLNM